MLVVAAWITSPSAITSEYLRGTLLYAGGVTRAAAPLLSTLAIGAGSREATLRTTEVTGRAMLFSSSMRKARAVSRYTRVISGATMRICARESLKPLLMWIRLSP